MWTTILTIVLWGPSFSAFFWCFMDYKRPMNARAYPMDGQSNWSGYERSTGMPLCNPPPPIAQASIGTYPQVYHSANRYHHRLWLRLPFQIQMDFRYPTQSIRISKRWWEHSHNRSLPVFGNCNLLFHLKATWVTYYLQWLQTDNPSMRSPLYHPDSSKRVCMLSPHRMQPNLSQRRSVVTPFQSSIEELATQQLQRNEMDGINPHQSNASNNTLKNVKISPHVDA